METKRNWRNMVEHRPELDGNTQNVLETTILYKTRAQLTPTLTHVITYDIRKYTNFFPWLVQAPKVSKVTSRQARSIFCQVDEILY